jgi:SAM-dependent methyltransferase
MTAGAPIRFDDGAAYERMMGRWSRLAGGAFLDWLAPPPGLRWLDVGCGSGVFTELLVERCAPVAVDGVDPSEGMLAYARERPVGRIARFQKGDAMVLPYPDDAFDVAVMALVVFFLPEPARGLAEMVRVVRPGGIVCTYAWDMLGGGFPGGPMLEEMRALGVNPPRPPSEPASRMAALLDLWRDAGLQDLRATEVVVQRSFESFDDYWNTNRLSPSFVKLIDDSPVTVREALRDRLSARMPADASGRIVAEARANAVTGRVPG